MNQGKVFSLVKEQLEAVDPGRSIWLAASAGTGKTQVLSTRAIRLMLRDEVKPEEILCLTFTKAGATEMAIRINTVLARWVRIDEAKLRTELSYLGASTDVKTIARARTLFASVLDCPGGGLRIDTIHAFSQWLLSNFPEEAGLPLGVTLMEDRQRDVLLRTVLSSILLEAERAKDGKTLGAVESFVLAHGEEALQKWLMRCSGACRVWDAEGRSILPIASRLKEIFGIPKNADNRWLTQFLSPAMFPDETLKAMLPALEVGSAKRSLESAAFIQEWLETSCEERLDKVSRFYVTILNKNGSFRTMSKASSEDPKFEGYQQEIERVVRQFEENSSLLEMANVVAPWLELGRLFSREWEKAKAREGFLEFDDLIAKAAGLLNEKSAADWIRFKLDRQFNHILVDEAQDTNRLQWKIIGALIDDFFTGESAAGEKNRTIFTVGDYKQAIFGFQGTSPDNFLTAKAKVAQAVKLNNENNSPGIYNHKTKEFVELELNQSFRTSNYVLSFVDRVLDKLGPESLGINGKCPVHKGQDRPGLVTLWSPVNDMRSGNSQDLSEVEHQNWFARHDRMMAEKIATQIGKWTTGIEPLTLHKGTQRQAGPGDIMVLVRSRKELAGLIVARLHAKGIPVAGVDRLRIGEPLAVKDLLSALRFAVQPLDDLELANLLSSPLIGWSQEDLLAHLPRQEGMRLWPHLRASKAQFVQNTVDQLLDLLSRTDFRTPQALLQWMLVGPWKGRKKLVERLGREVNDPIDELLNAAFKFESTFTPSIVRFIRWFDAGESELKRDPDDAPNFVRVMTVHGSKGLQAPIVILADATSSPGKVSNLSLEETPVGQLDKEPIEIPLPPIKKNQQIGRIADAYEMKKRKELQEHWRLLYVAMTRAEEALFIGGSLGPSAGKVAPNDSWYACIEPLFDQCDLDDELWGSRKEFGKALSLVKPLRQGRDVEELNLPKWLNEPLRPEPEPPKPFAPSKGFEVDLVEPPLATGMTQDAARRGVLIHSLLERLPDVEPVERMTAATLWLEKQAPELASQTARSIAVSCIDLIQDPRFIDIFASSSLAEVPLAAIVEGKVVSGVVDRLLITDTVVKVIDFKTTRRPPEKFDEIPKATLSQMSAYMAALGVIYPDREIRGGVLYTEKPILFELQPIELTS